MEPEEDQACPICYEEIQEQGALSCFCFSCIVEWSKQSNTCPLCKQRFTEVRKTLKRKREGKEELPKKKLRQEIVQVPHRNIGPSPSSHRAHLVYLRNILANGVFPMHYFRPPSVAGGVIDLTQDEVTTQTPPRPPVIDLDVIVLD